VRGRNVQSVVADIQKKLEAGVKLPPGYYITYAISTSLKKKG
jgi:Cu/Ag efflux pump CusA